MHRLTLSATSCVVALRNEAAEHVVNVRVRMSGGSAILVRTQVQAEDINSAKWLLEAQYGVGSVILYVVNLRSHRFLIFLNVYGYLIFIPKHFSSFFHFFFVYGRAFNEPISTTNNYYKDN